LTVKNLHREEQVVCKLRHFDGARALEPGWHFKR
jgi:hypothetical protein